MKNKVIYTRIVALALMTIIGISTTYAQNSTQALSKVSARYKKYKTIEANFAFKYFRNEQDQAAQSETGSILLDQRTGKYRITTPSQVLISDGKSQWAVLHDADEVQVTEVDQAAGSITPFNVFSFFESGYTHRLLPAERAGNIQLDVIELTPEDKRKNYSKIILRVDPSKSHLHSVTVFDKNKSRYSYEISNLKIEPTLTANKFMFDKAEFPGMEIVDLR